MPRIVHIVGTGTIGEPLIGLLADHRADFGIDEVTFHKRAPIRTDRAKIQELIGRRGARLAVDADRHDAFVDFGMRPTYTAEEALERATVVIDCTPTGNENKELTYEGLVDTVRGFIAQGSEFGFGKLYARGVNDRALVPGEDRFVQIASCNTHNLAVILETVAFDAGGYDNLEAARFLVIRRANDISQDDGYCPSPMVNKHTDPTFGTHHARDVFHLYRSLGVDLRGLFSSSLKVNTQYMHTIHFSVRLKAATTLEQILETIKDNDRLALTWKTSANAVFSFGRDHGHYGRILNQTVFCQPSLHVSQDGREVTGFCFTPQDGNPLLSSVAAMLWFLEPSTYESRLQALKPYFFDEV
jgi:glyceraldehyde-3-phosphate dehydrogenase/erythrose-4-phosphate dehydrogenase